MRSSGRSVGDALVAGCRAQFRGLDAGALRIQIAGPCARGLRGEGAGSCWDPATGMSPKQWPHLRERLTIAIVGTVWLGGPTPSNYKADAAALADTCRLGRKSMTGATGASRLLGRSHADTGVARLRGSVHHWHRHGRRAGAFHSVATTGPAGRVRGVSEDSFAPDPAEPAPTSVAPAAAEPAAGVVSGGSTLRGDLAAAIDTYGGHLADVFHAYDSGITSQTQIAATGVCDGNVGAVGNYLLRVRTLLGEEWASTPKQAAAVARFLRSLRRKASLSQQADEHVTRLLADLADITEDEVAQATERREQEEVSARLEGDLETAAGVYVYTYPHYWNHPIWVDPVSEDERFLLKVGRSSGAAGTRIRAQRNAGSPEAPQILRVYVTADPEGVEAKFHRLLDAAGHTRGTGGREWFATTIEFCDALADLLGLEIRT